MSRLALGSRRKSPETAKGFCVIGSKKCDSDFRESAKFSLFNAFVTEFSFDCSKKIANLSSKEIFAFTGQLSRTPWKSSRNEIAKNEGNRLSCKQIFKMWSLHNELILNSGWWTISGDGTFLSASQVPNTVLAR
jgi:hypothetical protein